MKFKVKSTTGVTEAYIKDLERTIGGSGISYVSQIAALGRKRAYESYFSKSIRQGGLDLIHGTTTHDSTAGRVDRLGRRLVSFSLESKNTHKKAAYFSSYPANLWERRSDGRGIHLFETKLPPVIADVVPQAIEEVNRKLQRRIDAINIQSRTQEETV